jgi:hypothetical protein
VRPQMPLHHLLLLATQKDHTIISSWPDSRDNTDTDRVGMM